MGRSYYPFKTRFTRMLILACCMVASLVQADSVGLVVENKSPQTVAFYTQLADMTPDHDIQLYSLDNLPDDLSTTPVDRWVAMGAKSLAIMLGRLNSQKPALGLFVSEQAITKLTSLYPKAKYSILDNTPTLDRQLALIKAIDPQVKSIAYYHADDATAPSTALIKMAKSLKLDLNASPLPDPLNWERDSLKALKDSDVVMGIDDSGVYNATTIRSILMRLYRANKPLFGPDNGYVRAGAVASTYSGVKETLQATAQLLNSTKPWPRVIKNPYYDVSINEQVARSLNLTLDPPEKIRAKMEALLP